MGWRKKKELVAKIDTLISVCEQSASLFDETFTRHLKGIHTSTFLFGIDSIHKSKSESSNCVDEVRVILYSSSFPSARDDLMQIVHSLSLIVEDCAHVLYHIRNHSIETFSDSEEIFLKLKDQVLQCIRATTNLCRQIITTRVNRSTISEQVVNVCRQKDLADTIQDEAIQCLFSNAPSDAIKLEQSGIVTEICTIPQRCQSLANQIEILILTENE